MGRLEHVGIAVVDEADLLQVLVDLLGENAYATETLEADGIRTHFVSGSSAKIELLERLREDSAVASFLERRGPGLHHLAFEVADIHSMFNRARNAGYDPIDPAPRPGANGKLIFFLHPKQTAGLLLEFCQAQTSLLKPVATGDLAGIRRIHAASGSNSVPPLVYVFDGAPGVDPERLASRLHPGRTIYTIDAESTVDFDALLKQLSVDRLHLAADGAPSADLHYRIDDDRVRSTVLIDPDDVILDNGKPTESTPRDSDQGDGAPGSSMSGRLRDIRTRVLVLFRDDADGLRRAAALRGLRTNLQLAVVSEPDLRAALVDAYLQ
ncbi:MAG: methylmalonyl-CoA epimerase [Rhodothermales bacterium]